MERSVPVVYNDGRSDDFTVLLFPPGLTWGEVTFLTRNIVRHRNGEPVEEVFEALLTFLAGQGVTLYEEC